MDLVEDSGRSAVSETSILMKTDAVFHSHRALRRELCFTRLVVIAFLLTGTAVFVLLYTQHLPGCKSTERGDEGNDGEALEMGAPAEAGSEDPPHQAFLKIACEHPSASDLLMWENRGLVGFSLSNANTTLIIPSHRKYRIALQVTYRGSDHVHLAKQTILEHHLLLYSDSYQSNRIILSAFETIYYESTNWRKSVYSEGIFTFDKGDQLKVQTSNLRLVDCDGNVGAKTFFTAHPHV